MGETGCGKTRLIRFMCELQAGPNGPKNLLLMKVCLPLCSFHDVSDNAILFVSCIPHVQVQYVHTVLTKISVVE